MFKRHEEKMSLINPPASFKSRVWQYFDFLKTDKGVRETDKSKSICKICKFDLIFQLSFYNLAFPNWYINQAFAKVRKKKKKKKKKKIYYILS